MPPPLMRPTSSPCWHWQARELRGHAPLRRAALVRESWSGVDPAGARLDRVITSGTPLHWAVGEGAAAAVRGRYLAPAVPAAVISTPRPVLQVDALLAHGASPDVPDPDGLTPLLLAVATGRAGCVARLLARQPPPPSAALPPTPTQIDRAPPPPHAQAAGADAGATLPGVGTALHVAADVGSESTVTAILNTRAGRCASAATTVR